MGERKTKKELEQIKLDYNVKDLYSWSKYNLMCTDWYSYFLRYVKRIKEDRNDSIYGAAGGTVHDLLENFYNRELKKEELESSYDEKMFELETCGLKFNRNDEEKNEKIAEKYHYCNRHFFRNFSAIKGENIELEKFLLIRVSKLLFQGYSDFEHEEVVDGVRKKIITDFKTSTIYTGKKIDKEKGQLLLYALSKIQEGWNIEDIIIRWLFTKYVSVEVPDKKSETGYRIRNISRDEIGSKLKASVKAQLKKVRKYNYNQVEGYLDNLLATKTLPSNLDKAILIELEDIKLTKSGELKKTYINKFKKVISTYKKYSEDQIESFLEEMCLMNNLDCIPEEVRSLFKIKDCYVEIPFTKEDIRELQVSIIKKVVEASKKEIEYKKTKDDSVFFDEIDSSNEYFHAVLSGYSPKLHKPYKKYLDKKNKNRNENIDDEDSLDMNELFAELGIEI